jgi:hypothetical protein
MLHAQSPNIYCCTTVQHWLAACSAATARNWQTDPIALCHCTIWAEKKSDTLTLFWNIVQNSVEVHCRIWESQSQGHLHLSISLNFKKEFNILQTSFQGLCTCASWKLLKKCKNNPKKGDLVLIIIVQPLSSN